MTTVSNEQYKASLLAHVSKNITIPAYSEATERVKSNFIGEGSSEP
jgi:hypothetical protein